MASVQRQRRRDAGFTMVELLVVMLFFFITLVIGYPALQRTFHRSRIEGIARETSVLMGIARLEAIKRNRTTEVFPDAVNREIVAFVDLDEDGIIDPGEDVLGRYAMPRGVTFTPPPGDTDPPAGDETTFGGDGAADAETGIRFGDPRENFLEVRISTRATGRVIIRKWNGSGWFALGEGSGGRWVWN